MKVGRKDKKTAFVMAGGGSLGAVQVGMLKAVMDFGLKADFLVGASVGAINAAFFASDPTQKGVDRLEGIWKGIRRRDIFPITPLGSLFGFLSWKENLCSPKPLKRLINRHVSFQRLEDAKLKCIVVGTDLFSGLEVSLSKGMAAEALLASSAIPGVFPPVKIGEHYLIDGGVTNNTPISVAVAKGAERIVVFPTGTSCGLKAVPKGVIEMALQTLNLAISQRLMSDLEKYHEQIEIIVLPPLCPLDVSIFNFSHTEELIDRSEENVRTWIKNGGLEAGIKPDYLKPHHH
jgi:NTE family protein